MNDSFAVAFFFKFTSGKWVSSAQIHQSQINYSSALLFCCLDHKSQEYKTNSI